MPLILEIVLTIAAWRRGWRGWALLPLCICLLVGLVMGSAIASSGGSTRSMMQDSLVVGLIGDLITAASLVVMVIRPRSAERHDARWPVADAADRIS